jgi:hypothetical protein
MAVAGSRGSMTAYTITGHRMNNVAALASWRMVGMEKYRVAIRMDVAYYFYLHKGKKYRSLQKFIHHQFSNKLRSVCL